MCGQDILIDQIFIHEQLGISKEGVVDAANVTFDKTKTSLKKIASPHAFVENGQWNIVRMEEFHAKFVVILQILYQRNWLAYSSNRIIITFDLANMGQPITGDSVDPKTS
jgi:hypothetical protein